MQLKPCSISKFTFKIRSFIIEYCTAPAVGCSAITVPASAGSACVSRHGRVVSPVRSRFTLRSSSVSVSVHVDVLVHGSATWRRGRSRQSVHTILARGSRHARTRSSRLKAVNTQDCAHLSINAMATVHRICFVPRSAFHTSPPRSPATKALQGPSRSPTCPSPPHRVLPQLPKAPPPPSPPSLRSYPTWPRRAPPTPLELPTADGPP